MSLLSIASVPATTVSRDTTVFEAARLMAKMRIGAVAVVERDRLCGIFTERDLMTRVVAEERDPRSTRIGEVMTAEAETAFDDMSFGDALRVMVDRHIRHLPVVDNERRVRGMLSVRNVLQHRVEDLSNQLDSVMNYFSADGIGG
jgi:CBS domain-containing protein